MKNIVLLIALSFASLSQAALTKVPGSMLGTGAVASQGATGKVDIQSVYFGLGADCETDCNVVGNCVICSQVGGKITSVSATNTTGSFRLNGIDGAKYNCTGTGVNQGIGGTLLNHTRAVSTSTFAHMQAWFGGSGNESARNSVICVGIP